MNKNLLKLKKSMIISALTSSIIFSLTGCNSNGNNLTYNTLEDGTIEVSGTIDYDSLCKYYFLVINYSNGSSKYYIVEEKIYLSVRGYGCIEYINIRNDKSVLIIYENVNFIDERFKDVISYETINLGRYIIMNDYVKDYYSIEDTNVLLEEMTNEYEQSDNKELIYVNE